MTMDAKEYQKLAARTLIDGPDFELTDKEIMLVWNAIGLAGESGEVCDLIKKWVFHRHAVNISAIVKELGDCLWYVAAICTKLDLDMNIIMEANIDKLQQRYPNGYSSDASQSRIDIIVG